MTANYTETLDHIKAALTPQHIKQAERTVDRLYAELPDKTNLHNNKVMVLFGGGKDSTWTLAYTRLVQLLMHEKYGDAFTLRSLTGRQPGMQFAVMQNIDRAYKALGMVDDPLAETLLIHNKEVVPFNRDVPIPEEVTRLNRADVLMNGHRFGADARRVFCDHCNVNLAGWIGTAAAFKDGADTIITGDSTDEQKTYAKWVAKLAHDFDVDVSELRNVPALKGILARIDGIGKNRSRIIHDSDAEAEARSVNHNLPKESHFFNIFADTQYTARDHLSLLKDFIKFDFDSLMSSFTETDCGNPALMAHLHGLTFEKLYPGHGYADGIREYVQFGLELMTAKDFPQELKEMMRERYKDDKAIAAMRKKVEQYAFETYQLTPEHMTAMVYAPLGSKGKNLHVFLEREYAGLLPQEKKIRDLLGKDDAPKPGDGPLVQKLETITGLTLDQMRISYRSELAQDPLDPKHQTDAFGALLKLPSRGDPHQRNAYVPITVGGKRIDSGHTERIITGR